MRVAFLLLLAVGLHGQILAPVMFGVDPDVTTPTNTDSGGSCTGAATSRTCTGTTTVSFADPSADFIRYTNDGSTTPTFTTGTLYTTGISTASTTTYKAIGCKVQNRKCGAVLTSVYTISSGSVTLDSTNSQLYQGCPSPVLLSCTFSVTYSTGEAVFIGLAYCIGPGGSCGNITPDSTWTLSDGTNTYTQTTPVSSGTSGAGCGFADNTGSAQRLVCFTAANVTGGTYTLTIGNSASGTPHYLSVAVIVVSGTPSSGVIDTATTESTSGTSATPSVTSAGNPSKSGELCTFNLQSFAAPTNSGAYTQLYNANNNLVSYVLNPSTGSTTTASATQSSATWAGSLVCFEP